MKQMRILIAMIVVIFALTLPLNASETETRVYYKSDKIQSYPLLLEVKGNGKVVDGSETIENGSIEYALRYGEQKEFRILPEEGNQLAHVYYEVEDAFSGTRIKDIKSEVEGESLILKVEQGKMHLIIEFEQKKEVIIPPATSDGSNQMLYTGFMILSYVILLFLMKVKKIEKRRGNAF